MFLMLAVFQLLQYGLENRPFETHQTVQIVLSRKNSKSFCRCSANLKNHTPPLSIIGFTHSKRSPLGNRMPQDLFRSVNRPKTIQNPTKSDRFLNHQNYWEPSKIEDNQNCGEKCCLLPLGLFQLAPICSAFFTPTWSSRRSEVRQT